MLDAFGRYPTVAPDVLFKQGLDALAVGKAVEASQLFERALTVARRVGAKSQEARYVSWHAFSKAKAYGATPETVRLCEEAAGDTPDAELLLNLVRIYLLAGLRTRALAALERGLRRDPHNRRLADLLARIDRRAKPPIRFLDRGHSINRLLTRLLRRRPESAQPPGAAGR